MGDSPPPRSTQGHILLVEDDVSTAELLTLLLTEAGFHVSWAKDGSTVLALFSRPASAPTASPEPGPIDLILLDLALPDMDAVDLIKTLMLDKRPLPPVIILSARSPVSIQVAADFMGAVAVIRKPFLRETLLSVVHDALKDRPA